MHNAARGTGRVPACPRRALTGRLDVADADPHGWSDGLTAHDGVYYVVEALAPFEFYDVTLTRRGNIVAVGSRNTGAGWQCELVVLGVADRARMRARAWLPPLSTARVGSEAD